MACASGDEVCAADETRAETIRRLERRIDDLRDLVADTESKVFTLTKEHSGAKERLAEASAAYAGSQRALDTARVKAKQTRDAETRVILELKRRAEADPRYGEAQARVDAAQAEVEQARTAVKATLKESPAYTEAVAALGAAQAEVERDKDAKDRAAMLDASQRALAADAAVARIEREALDGDEAYRAASQKLTIANAHLGNVNDAIDRAMKTDFLRVESRRADEQARAELTDAEKTAKVQTQRARAAEATFRKVDAALSRAERDLESYRQSLADTRAALAAF
ncbi:MAG: hypothetical protein GC159_04770 [Phycisphaera sp.]|nr:hypothetical protein [Phycisphaera sp.]